ncbi:pVI [Canine mastadenovirus A]|uniref:Pre-protein VI n=2 Tax=Canine adenovirus serotype 2 TaxID=10514 RepID=P87561_ADECT|nr:pVI [Canine adenovirus 2]WIV79579.1 pVI [Canine mastadenovirus A]AAB38724.1 protein VI precursor [Canine adenovirus 2]QJS39029.1 pVI [Canine adenovirus 2]UZP80963.1 protein VI precursor [Canine adenovirus 2]WET31996.1 protein VI precursor [Canine adenovirus 2]
MDAVNFSILAPRYGAHPMMSGWSGIGTSGMNGGAFNWGGIWSGIKNFGSNVKSWGSKAWNSQTGKLLRQKLNDTKVREKLVEGISTGVHGALDIANQELAKQIERRLERQQPLEPEVEVEEEVVDIKPEAQAPLVVQIPKKRPRDEDLLITADEPPSYEESIKTMAPLMPMTRPHPSMAKPVLVDRPTTLELKPSDQPPAYSPPAPSAVRVTVPSNIPVVTPARSRGWQGTLANIVGVGLSNVKRRRCF